MQETISIGREFVEKLHTILEHHLDDEHFGVSELASAAGISRSGLHRKMQAFNGKSTSQFIREYRLKKAMDLLLQTESTVAEIAYRVGFASPTYFNTCFKDYYGVTPGEARLRNKPRDFRLFNNKWFIWTFLMVVLATVGIVAYTTSETPEIKLPTQSPQVPVEKTIAVLPIKNWSGDSDLDYISDGMTDAVISRITEIRGFKKVIPFTSVLRYRSSDLSIPVIAEELNVQNILQGNFQLAGGQMKISFQLINGLTNEHFWSEEYSGKWNTDEVFDIQAAVAENVANRMNVEIKEDELKAVNTYPTRSKEAYDYFMKARFEAYKYSGPGIINSIPLYEEAIRLDSNFIEPYIDLAGQYIRGGASWGVISEKEAWQKTKVLLLKALQIDSTHLEATKALNDGLYLYEWDFETMEKNYRTKSNNTVNYCLQTGRNEEALAIVEQLKLELCVNEKISMESCVLINTSKAGVLSMLNRKEEALEILKSKEELYPDNYLNLRMAARINFYLEEFERSHALLRKIMKNYPDRPPILLMPLAVCEYRRANIREAKEIVAELERKYQMDASGSPAWFLALYYAALGDHEQTFVWLQRSYHRHEVEMIWLRADPLLKPLRSDPRYIELYNNVGFPMPLPTN